MRGGHLLVFIEDQDDFTNETVMAELLRDDGSRVIAKRVHGVPWKTVAPTGNYRLVLRVNGKLRGSQPVVVLQDKTTTVRFNPRQ